MQREELARALAAGGFVAAEEEADELLAWGGDLRAGLRRRLSGEPLAWITGGVDLAGLRLRVDPGVYVPRWTTELLAERAAQRLPHDGAAVDVCCGCGALAAVLRARRPGARVVATDIDPRAVACARANGVDARVGDLLDGVPGPFDVVAGVVPFVPHEELHLLQRDTFAFETPLAYDGGPGGTALLERLVADAPRVLRPGGALLLELGGDQAARLAAPLAAAGFVPVEVLHDEDGDVRGIEAVLERTPGPGPAAGGPPWAGGRPGARGR